MPSNFTVISTFCGAGGSSLGYKLAGGKVLLSIEWETNSCDSYRLNHPDTLLLNRDIATVSSDEILNLTGLNLYMSISTKWLSKLHFQCNVSLIKPPDK